MTTTLTHEIPELQETGEVMSWIREVSGADLVFPGHPVVIACAIMALYSSKSQAMAGTELGSIDAMANLTVPGTGDCVRVALQAMKNGVSESEMLDEMNRYWSRSLAGGHIGNVDPGIAQAMKFAPYFRENVGPWLAEKAVEQPPEQGSTMRRNVPLPAELEALATEITAALDAAGFNKLGLGAAEVRENCRLIDLADKANEHRALQPAAMSLYGILKGLAICEVITHMQLMSFAAAIYSPTSPAQPEVKPATEIRG